MGSWGTELLTDFQIIILCRLIDASRTSNNRGSLCYDLDMMKGRTTSRRLIIILEGCQIIYEYDYHMHYDNGSAAAQPIPGVTCCNTPPSWQLHPCRPRTQVGNKALQALGSQGARAG